MDKTYIDILELLEKESSTLKKIAIIRENISNTQLKEYLKLSLSKDITFGVIEFDFTVGDGRFDDVRAFENFISLTDQLSKRELTGNSALDRIKEVFSWFNKSQCKWFKKCLQKDLSSIGIGQSLFDKAYDEKTKFKLGLAEEVEALDMIDDEIPGYLDKKCNGYRTTIFVEDSKIDIIYSGRSGIEAKNFYFIKDELESLVSKLPDFFKNGVYDGEMHVDDDNHLTTTLYGFKWRSKDEFMGKKGLKEKAWSDYCLREQEVLDLQSRAKFVIFDYIPRLNWDKQAYSKILVERKRDLETINCAISELGLKQIEIVPTEWVKTKTEAIKAAQKWINLGFEGGVFKVYNGCYQWKRWRTWIKIKKECSFSIQLTRFDKQKEKWDTSGNLKPDMVGAIWGVDKFGNEHKIGTGDESVFSEKIRADMFNNWDSYKGVIYDCTAQEPSKASNKYINPRLIAKRLDLNSLTD